MYSLSPNERSLLAALREWEYEVKNSGIKNLLLGELPFRLPRSMNINWYDEPPLPPTRRNRTNLYPQHWPEQGLQSSYMPIFLFVVDGEADITLGFTQEMLDNARQNSATSAGVDVPEKGRLDVEMSKGDMAILPAGMPFPDGIHGHWFRHDIERAQSYLLWVLVTPEGAICHSCRTINGKHQHQEHVMLRDNQLNPLTALLIEELQGYRKCQQETALALVQGLIRHLQEGISEGFAFALDNESRLFDSEAGNSPQPFSGPVAFKRACRYIRSNLDNELSVAKIAQQAHISPTQLNRLFQSEMGMAVMQYVTQCRMESAHSLLLDTQLRVEEVARLVGYPRPSHFSRAFTQATGMSPAKFRQRKRFEIPVEK